MNLHLKELEFSSFKGVSKFKSSLSTSNIFEGANNTGKMIEGDIKLDRLLGLLTNYIQMERNVMLNSRYNMELVDRCNIADIYRQKSTKLRVKIKNDYGKN